MSQRALSPPVIGHCRFYEKVVKVKADVAAILIYFLSVAVPSTWPSISAMPHRGDAQGGFQRSVLKPLLRGEPRPLPRRGGNPPAPAFPLGETGKGDQIPCCRRRLCS